MVDLIPVCTTIRGPVDSLAIVTQENDLRIRRIHSQRTDMVGRAASRSPGVPAIRGFEASLERPNPHRPGCLLAKQDAGYLVLRTRSWHDFYPGVVHVLPQVSPMPVAICPGSPGFVLSEGIECQVAD